MWNNTEIALAHLITFRCHCTWLHGDERGSIDRRQNRYGSPYIPADARWREDSFHLLKHSPVKLSSSQRVSVENAIRETCNLRGWRLFAVNVRTNHVHVVLSIGPKDPGMALNALKANATRQMRQDGHWAHTRSPWADKGSQRYLWTDVSVERAIRYVIDGQGGPLPDFHVD